MIGLQKKKMTINLDGASMREIVTLSCNIDILSALRKLIETNSTASSNLKQTVSQNSKMIIDMDKHLCI